MSNPIEAVVVGAGDRGRLVFGRYALAHPEEIRVVAVAEPQDEKREAFAKMHGLAPDRVFRSHEDLYAKGRLAEALVCCTQDKNHLETAQPALEMGYDVLLEKPMSNSLEGTVRLVQAAEKHGRLLMICHVLRYTSFFDAIHEIIASGRIGDVVTVEHRENVAYWHMAHSFVRGNWRNSAIESPMILAKCCHDMDILYWNMGPVRRLNSFGSLFHYRKENAPKGAPARCLDGCPVAEECPFYAGRQYLGEQTGWPVSVISVDTSLEARRRALETGPYGRCVYQCDNNVVDNQTVNFEFESGASGTLFMHGHSHQEGRSMRYDGTRGTLRARFGGAPHGEPGVSIEVHDHRTNKCETIEPDTSGGGHGGGDPRLYAAFARAVRDRSQVLTTARESLESHLMAFAAEKARVNGSVIQMDEFRQRAEEAARKN